MNRAMGYGERGYEEGQASGYSKLKEKLTVSRLNSPIKYDDDILQVHAQSPPTTRLSRVLADGRREGQGPRNPGAGEPGKSYSRQLANSRLPTEVVRILESRDKYSHQRIPGPTTTKPKSDTRSPSSTNNHHSIFKRFSDYAAEKRKEGDAISPRSKALKNRPKPESPHFPEVPSTHDKLSQYKAEIEGTDGRPEAARPGARPDALEVPETPAARGEGEEGEDGEEGEEGGKSSPLSPHPRTYMTTGEFRAGYSSRLPPKTQKRSTAPEEPRDPDDEIMGWDSPMSPKQSFDDLLCKTGWGEEAGPEAEGERGGGPLGGLSFPGR